MNKYYKNFILCGDIDFHCLLCQENFHSLPEVEKHLRWEKHRKALKTQAFVPKFRKDFVYKVGDNYYCEPCNYIITENANITAHVKEETHKMNKGKPKTDAEVESALCKKDSGYIIVSDIIVTEQHWHCIHNKECLLCATPVMDAGKHINSTKHVLKIIKAKITKDNEDRVFRKINDESFYCFTCNKVIFTKSLENHWSDTEHRIIKNASINRITASILYECKKKEFDKNKVDAQKDVYDIDFKNLSAMCRECKRSINLDCNLMLDHQKKHESEICDRPNTYSEDVKNVDESSSEDEASEVVYSEVTDHGKRRADLAKFGKQHYIKLNPGASKGYCTLCHANICGNMNVFKEHVKGVRHKFNLELKGLRSSKEHKSPDVRCNLLVNYLNSLYYSRAVRIVCMNQEICVDIESFLLFSKVLKNPHLRKSKCFVCDVLFPTGEEIEHFTTDKHKNNYLGAKVLMVKGEFVREIRPDVFHCGICNKVYPFWELMDRHLHSLKHESRRANKELILQLANQWYNEELLVKTSSNPDILYVQVGSLGIFQ